MEQKSAQSGSQFFDSLSGTLIITNTAGEVIYTNKAIEKRTGFSVPEVVGKRPGNLWGGNMKPEFYHGLWYTIEKKKAPFIAEVKNISKDGSKHDEELHIAPILSTDGHVQYFVEIHPESGGKKNKKKFREEFMEVFTNQRSYGLDLMEWIFSALSQSSSGASKIKEQIKEAVAEKSTLASHLYSTFVLPVKKTFKLREEDKNLIKAAQSNPQDFWLLYKKYKDDIHQYFSRRLVGKPEVAEELMQETFLKAFKYLDKFTISNASYRTYLLRIAHNLLVNYYRQVQAVSIDDFSDIFFAEEKSDFDILDKERLARAISQLGEVEQQIFKMKYEEGLKAREIAVILQKTENAVKLHLSRGRKKLRGLFL